MPLEDSFHFFFLLSDLKSSNVVGGGMCSREECVYEAKLFKFYMLIKLKDDLRFKDKQLQRRDLE